MAIIKENNVYRYICDTADVASLPTGVPAGSTAIDRQTSKKYITYDGTNWTLLDNRSRLVDSGGTEVTESTGHSVNVNALAGTAIIGKVGIDQTTPGTTDRVTANVDKVGGTAITPLTGTEGGSSTVQLPVTALLHGKTGANTSSPITVKSPAAGVTCDAYPIEATVWPMLFNGATYDQKVNNAPITLLASAARTATTTSPDQTNYNARGVMLVFDVTAVPGGEETVMFKLYSKDALSGKYNILFSGSALSTTGTRVYFFYPSIMSGLGDGQQDMPLPRSWRIAISHSASGSFTYSVAGCYLL